jgi:hypothetical protein
MQFKPSIAGIIIGVLLCVAVFLPWITADFAGFSVDANGTDVYPGIVTLIMGILAVILSIFAYYRVAAAFIGIAGLVAAGGVAGYWFLEYYDFQSLGMGTLVTLTPSYGLYVAGGLAIVLMINGFASVGGSRAPTPPPYQAPPQNYSAPPQNYNAPPPPPPSGPPAPPPPPPVASG